METKRSKLRRYFNQFTYVLGIIIIFMLIVASLFEKDAVDAVALIITAVSVLGISIIEFKGFINGGINWKQTYEQSKHKVIHASISLLIVTSLTGLTIYIGRNPFAFLSVNGEAIESTFLFNIVAFLLVVSVLLSLLNVLLMGVNKVLDKLSEKLNEISEDLDEEDEAGGLDHDIND